MRTKAGLLSRRHAVAVLAGLPLATIARAQSSPLTFSGIAVDLTPLERLGGTGAAAMLRPELLARLRTVFADRLSQPHVRAPVLVARISYLSMTSYGGYDDVEGIGPNDTIEGDGLVVDGRTTLSSTHILTELSPSYSGAYNTPGIDQIRIQSIAYQFAYWLRREMNL